MLLLLWLKGSDRLLFLVSLLHETIIIWWNIAKIGWERGEKKAASRTSREDIFKLNLFFFVLTSYSHEIVLLLTRNFLIFELGEGRKHQKSPTWNIFHPSTFDKSQIKFRKLPHWGALIFVFFASLRFSPSSNARQARCWWSSLCLLYTHAPNKKRRRKD